MIPVEITKVADSLNNITNSNFFKTIMNRVLGYKLTIWEAEQEIIKQSIHDTYQSAKEMGLSGMSAIEHVRKYVNLINTISKSEKYVDKDIENKIEYDNDFFWNIIEHSKTISNEQVQELIAKIIAGEYNAPGTYSISTLQAIKLLGKKELETFEKMGSLLVNKLQLPQILFSIPFEIKELMSSLDLDFGVLQEFQTFGLIFPNPMTNAQENTEGNTIIVRYFDKKILYKPIRKSDKIFNVPNYFCLSNSGIQIMNNLTPTFNEEYYKWLIKNYKVRNYEIIIP